MNLFNETLSLIYSGIAEVTIVFLLPNRKCSAHNLYLQIIKRAFYFLKCFSNNVYVRSCGAFIPASFSIRIRLFTLA